MMFPERYITLFPLLLAMTWRCISGLAMQATPCTLLTFDVDGTLVQGSTKAAENSAHARAFGYAIGRVFGGRDDYHLQVPSPPLIIPPECYHGSTDGIIALNMAYYGFQIEPSKACKRLIYISFFTY